MRAASGLAAVVQAPQGEKALSLEHVSPTSLLIPALNLPPEVSVGVGGANVNEGGEGIVWVGGAPAGVGGAPWERARLA